MLDRVARRPRLGESLPAATHCGHRHQAEQRNQIVDRIGGVEVPEEPAHEGNLIT